MFPTQSYKELMLSTVEEQIGEPVTQVWKDTGKMAGRKVMLKIKELITESEVGQRCQIKKGFSRRETRRKVL